MEACELDRRPLEDFLAAGHVEGPRAAVPWAPATRGRTIEERRKLAGDEALVEDACLVRDPTLGLPSEVRKSTVRSLAALGDSISHGVQGAVVARPHHAWPTLLGRMLDIDVRIAPPRRFAKWWLETGLEIALRLTRDRRLWLIRPLAILQQELAAADDEHDRPPPTQLPDVLAVNGYDLDDALDGPSPSEGRNAYTRDVLGTTTSPMEALRQRCAATGPPDLLIVMLGANCVLRSVVTLDARWRCQARASLLGGPDGSSEGKPPTIWTPALFHCRYGQLVREIANLGIPNVVLATVPHVSVAPVATGSGELPEAGDGAEQPYFPAYRWLFDRGEPSFKQLSGTTVHTIDQTIDAYNRIIRTEVARRRRAKDGNNWLLFDLCGVLDHVALKRNEPAPGGERLREFPEALFSGLKRPGTRPADDPAQEYLDSRFLLSGPSPTSTSEGAADQGGLVSVDGVHPSAAGQLVLARALARTLQAGGITLPARWAMAVDTDELLHDDPLLRWFVDPEAKPMPTRQWLHWLGDIESAVDDLSDWLR